MSSVEHLGPSYTDSHAIILPQCVLERRPCVSDHEHESFSVCWIFLKWKNMNGFQDIVNSLRLSKSSLYGELGWWFINLLKCSVLGWIHLRHFSCTTKVILIILKITNSPLPVHETFDLNCPSTFYPWSMGDLLITEVLLPTLSLILESLEYPQIKAENPHFKPTFTAWVPPEHHLVNSQKRSFVSAGTFPGLTAESIMEKGGKKDDPTTEKYSGVLFAN